MSGYLSYSTSWVEQPPFVLIRPTFYFYARTPLQPYSLHPAEYSNEPRIGEQRVNSRICHLASCQQLCINHPSYRVNGKEHTRRGPRALSRCPDASQRPAMELARPHTQNGRAPPCATSPTTMRQTNPKIRLWRCTRLEIQVAINLAKNRGKQRPSRRCEPH